MNLSGEGLEIVFRRAQQNSTLNKTLQNRKSSVAEINEPEPEQTNHFQLEDLDPKVVDKKAKDLMRKLESIKLHFENYLKLTESYTHKLTNDSMICVKDQNFLNFLKSDALTLSKATSHTTSHQEMHRQSLKFHALQLTSHTFDQQKQLHVSRCVEFGTRLL